MNSLLGGHEPINLRLFVLMVIFHEYWQLQVKYGGGEVPTPMGYASMVKDICIKADCQIKGQPGPGHKDT